MREIVCVISLILASLLRQKFSLKVSQIPVSPWSTLGTYQTTQTKGINISQLNKYLLENCYAHLRIYLRLHFCLSFHQTVYLFVTIYIFFIFADVSQNVTNTLVVSLYHRADFQSNN